MRSIFQILWYFACGHRWTALGVAFVFSLCVFVSAQERADTLAYEYVPLTKEQEDSILPPALLDSYRMQADSARQASSTAPQTQPGLFTTLFKRNNKFLSYLDRLVTGNVDRSFEKPIDISFIVMPSYTREGSFGIGGGATGLFRLDKTDSIMQPSDITLIGNVTLNGLFSLVANGNTHFPGRKMRLSYKLEYAYSPLDFWGVNREDCGRNPKVRYTRNQLKWNSDFVYRVTGNFNVGALLDFVYSEITALDDWSYLDGQGPSYFYTGLGFSLQYDTRDFILQPTRGMNFVIRGSVKPQFLGTDDRTLFNLSLFYNYYLPMWKGSILAVDAYGSFNSMESPWPLRESLGAGGVRMRGYYAGRYIDNNMVSVQAELRQHLFSRFGAVVWAGVGNVFSSFGHFRSRDLLPNFGVGLRVELKHNVNGRIDFGFGRGQKGFVFAIGEAF